MKRLVPLAFGSLLSMASLWAKPLDVAVDLKAAPMDSILEDFGKFSSQAFAGTPLAMYASPAMINMMLPGTFKMPHGVMDPKQSIHLIVTNPAPGAPPEVAASFPIHKGVDGKGKFQAMGYRAVSDKLFHLVEKKAFRDSHVWVDTSNPGMAVMSFGKKASPHLSAHFKSHKTAPVVAKGIVVEVKVEEIMARHGSSLRAGLEASKQAMGAAKVPPTMNRQQLTDAMQLGGTGAIGLLENLKSLNLTLQLDQNGLVHEVKGNAKAKSQLEKVTRVWSSHRGVTPAELSRYPAHAFQTTYAVYPPKLGATMLPLLKPFFEAFSRFTGGKMKAKDLEGLVVDMKSTSASSAVFPEGGNYTTWSVMDSSNAKDYAKYTEPLFDSMGDWISGMIPSSPNMKIDITTDYKKQAGKIDGHFYDTFSMRYNLKGDPSVVDAMKKATQNANVDQVILPLKDKILMAQGYVGTDVVGSAKKLLAMVEGGGEGIGKNKAWRAVQAPRSTTVSTTTLFLVDLIKMTMAQNAGSLPTLPGMDLNELIGQIPSSTVPMAVQIDAMPMELATTITLPANAVQELVSSVMQAAMAAQMQKMQQMQKNQSK